MIDQAIKGSESLKRNVACVEGTYADSRRRSARISMTGMLHDSHEEEQPRRRAAEPQTAPRLRLDQSMISAYTREIYATRTAQALAVVARCIWRRHDNGLNTALLEQLKVHVLVHRHGFDALAIAAIESKVWATNTRSELDRLTREAWRRYGSGERGHMNEQRLGELRGAIERRRAELERPAVPNAPRGKGPTASRP